MSFGQTYNTIDVEYATFNWLRREVALKMGYSPDHVLLNRTERVHVDSIIESGIAQFCQGAWPTAPRLPEEPSGEDRDPEAMHVEAKKEDKRRPPHRWSFMHLVYSISTVSGQSEYDLPADFSGVFQEPTTTREGGRIGIARTSHLRQLISAENEAGNPRYCALSRESVGGDTRSLSKLLLYPVPDAIETIQVEYVANPQTLSEISQFPPGGAEHAETVLAACFHVIAQRTGEGLEQAINLLQDRMTASIVTDNASARPTTDGVWVEDDGRFNLAYCSRMIGRHIGAGPNPKVWSHQQEQLLAEILRQGLRKVYNPPILPGENYPHDFSFLRPIGDLITSSGVSEYDLPLDFVQFFGPMTYKQDDAVLYTAIKFVGEERIRQLLQRPEASTRPSRAAVRVKSSGDAMGTRYELLLWPVPDDSYNLEYRYRINPDTSKANLLPSLDSKIDIHGGDRFSEMYIEAMMLCADYIMGKKRSEHEERFLRAVHSAVGQDRLTNATDSQGYNSDPTADRGDYNNGSFHDLDANITTYNGAIFD